jgi:hypothetical protein
MIFALVNAGVDRGYRANPRLAKVHWQITVLNLVRGQPMLWRCA